MESLSLEQARRLMMAGQGLLRPPNKSADCAELIRGLGYLQIDSINVLERAHHLTLGSRWDGYRRPLLKRAFEQDRALFEGWTHDACLIPVEHEPHWGVRRERFRNSSGANKWWTGRLGNNAAALQAQVLKRIEVEGPLPTRAFRTKEQKRGAWWGWTAEKSALEFAWKVGLLAICRREGFEKVYDLSERVLPPISKRPSREQTVAWSCSEAITRLGVATTRQIAAFWHFFKAAEIEPWCRAHLPQVLVDGEIMWARPDYGDLVDKLKPAPRRLRLLCPFDPLIRDRARMERFFGFPYRFEAFVPKAKRQYGYYVLPMLMGERLVGRLDAKLHRKTSTLEVLGCWWEPGERSKDKLLASELKRLAQRIGAQNLVLS